MPVFIGIDTSCHTTSVAVIDENGRLLAENRRLLAVEEGGRGIAQSAALFQHIREGSNIFVQAWSGVNENDVATIAVSTAPRNRVNSYMPIFGARFNAAKLLGAA